jgi:hypothetical protein
MHGSSTTPIVRVVFACTGCREPYEAIQIHRRATGAFACDFCGEVVWLWSGPYDYTDWRPVKTSEPRDMVVRNVSSSTRSDDYSRSSSTR